MDADNLYLNQARILEYLQCLNAKADEVLQILKTQGASVSTAIDNLSAQVAQNTSVEASAVQLIQGLASQLAASAGDTAKVTALAAQLQTSAHALAAAITANTPAAPTSTPAP